jgi:hypothetical protein
VKFWIPPGLNPNLQGDGHQSLKASEPTADHADGADENQPAAAGGRECAALERRARQKLKAVGAPCDSWPGGASPRVLRGFLGAAVLRFIARAVAAAGP